MEGVGQIVLEHGAWRPEWSSVTFWAQDSGGWLLGVVMTWRILVWHFWAGIERKRQGWQTGSFAGWLAGRQAGSSCRSGHKVLLFITYHYRYRYCL